MSKMHRIGNEQCNLFHSMEETRKEMLFVYKAPIAQMSFFVHALACSGTCDDNAVRKSCILDYWLGQGAEVGRDEVRNAKVLDLLHCSLYMNTPTRYPLSRDKFICFILRPTTKEWRDVDIGPSGMTEPMLNPLSAIMESPRSNFSSSLLLFVSSLSETLPPQRSDKKDITPFGVTPTRSLRVLVFL